MPAAPNTDNYFIGKGIVTFKPTGASQFYDLGNVPEFEFTPSTEVLEHFSSREGVRKRDKTVTLETGGEIRIVMEELTAKNLAMLLLGDVDESDPDVDVIELLSQSSVSGELRFYGTNDVGPKVEAIFLKVDFLPSGSFSPISDEWGQMEVTGQIAAVNGSFGTISVRKTSTLPVPLSIVPPSISGTAQEGEVLTANVGTWINSPTSFTYAWEADGAPIVGATNSTYTLVTGDVGAVITVVVTATNATGAGIAAESAPTAAVIAA